MKAIEVEAAWAALAGASACLAGLIRDDSGVLADAIDEEERTQVEAALQEAKNACDTLVDALHRDAFQAGVTLFDPSPERAYATLDQLRIVIRDGLADADGLADVLSLDSGELVPLASRLRESFQAISDALPGS